MQNLEVARQLPRHLAHMLPLELTNSVFLVCKVLSRGLQLVLEELGRVFRLLLPDLEILVDEQVRQLSSDLLRELRIARRVRHVEGSDLIVRITDQFNVDILPHARNLVVGRHCCRALWNRD